MMDEVVWRALGQRRQLRTGLRSRAGALAFSPGWLAMLG